MRLNIMDSYSQDIPLSTKLGQKASSAPMHAGKKHSSIANAQESAGYASSYHSFPPFVSSHTSHTASFLTAFQAVRSAVLVALNQIYKAAFKKEEAEQSAMPPMSAQQKLADILSKAQCDKRVYLNRHSFLDSFSATPSCVPATTVLRNHPKEE
jgi:hypothetical protein